MGACPSGRRSHHATLLVLCGLLRLVAGYVVPSYVRTYGMSTAHNVPMSSACVGGASELA